MKNINQTKLAQFEALISSNPKFTNIVESYAIGLTGDPNKPYVFGFKERSEVSSDAEAFCNTEFHNFFPTCELLPKMN